MKLKKQFTCEIIVLLLEYWKKTSAHNQQHAFICLLYMFKMREKRSYSKNHGF
jgi:hypothetical protein